MMSHVNKKMDWHWESKRELNLIHVFSGQAVLEMENNNPIPRDNYKAQTVSYLVRQERLLTIPFSQPSPVYVEMTLANVTQMTLQLCYI